MKAAQSASLAIAKLFSVVGKTVVVTGGGRGIGEMIARTFTENGANVYISSRSAETLRRTAERLSTTGPGKCTPLAEDLSTEVGCASFAKRFGELEGVDGQLHVLVNNSGIAWGESFDTFPEKVCCARWRFMGVACHVYASRVLDVCSAIRPCNGPQCKSALLVDAGSAPFP